VCHPPLVTATTHRAAQRVPGRRDERAPGRQRDLRDIERDLADSDPHLDELFFSFAQLVRGEKMPRTERIRTRPLRLGRRTGPRRAVWAGAPGIGLFMGPWPVW
jgi:hypothetical protein